MKFTQRSQALAAGISLLIMAIAAGFSYGYVRSGIEVPANPSATFGNLKESATLFKAGLGGWILIFITDLIVTFSLYLFFKTTQKNIYLITAAFRLVYTALLGMALISLFTILPLLQGQGMDADVAGQQVLSAL